jgi:molybdenum cofactor guanylyltransferase
VIMKASESSFSTHPPGVVLAGGLSRRMGQSKHTVLLAGRPMLDHVIEQLAPQVSAVAINYNGTPPRADLPCFADTLKDFPGPLAGIAAAMQFARTISKKTHVLTVPVDTPFVPMDLLARLLSACAAPDTVVLARSRDCTHPVIGLWPVHLDAHITEWLTAPKNRKLMVFLQSLNVVEVEYPDIQTAIGPLDPFFNVNTPDDLILANRYLRALEP